MPIVEHSLLHSGDPIAESNHCGKHNLYYAPKYSLSNICASYTIEDLCKEANNQIKWHGRHSFSYTTGHNRPTLNVSQLVKINMLYHSLATAGNIQPFLIFYNGQSYTITGDSRLRALGLLPHITTIECFITTSHKLNQYTKIDTFADFAEICQANAHTLFWIRLADLDCEYGLDWYSYETYDKTHLDSAKYEKTFCINAIQNYLNQQTDQFRFDSEWFKEKINWNHYVLE